MVFVCTPQRMLKAILSNVNSRQFRYREEAQSPEARDGEGTSRTQRGQELSVSHVLKERRRREKLNERFVVLRSLVPFVTKVCVPRKQMKSTDLVVFIYTSWIRTS